MDKTQGEIAYEALLAEDGIYDLREHPFFKDCFIARYDIMSSNGQIPVQVNIENGTIVLFTRQDLPTTKVGEYEGYKSQNKWSFSLEGVGDNRYFCVRNFSHEIYCHPQSYELSMKGQEIEIYDENEQLGHSYATSQNSVSKNSVAALTDGVLAVKMDVAQILSATQDLNLLGNLQNHTEFKVEVSARRTPGSGVIKHTSVTKNADAYEYASGYAPVNTQFPKYLSNRGESFIKYSDANYGQNGNVECLLRGVRSVEEALKTIEEQYQTYTEGRNRPQ